MIAVSDTNHLLRIAAAHERSPLFAAWRERCFHNAPVRLLKLDKDIHRLYNRSRFVGR